MDTELIAGESRRSKRNVCFAATCSTTTPAIPNEEYIAHANARTRQQSRKKSGYAVIVERRSLPTRLLAAFVVLGRAMWLGQKPRRGQPERGYLNNVYNVARSSGEILPISQTPKGREAANFVPANAGLILKNLMIAAIQVFMLQGRGYKQEKELFCETTQPARSAGSKENIFMFTTKNLSEMVGPKEMIILSPYAHIVTG